MFSEFDIKKSFKSPKIKDKKPFLFLREKSHKIRPYGERKKEHYDFGDVTGGGVPELGDLGLGDLGLGDLGLGDLGLGDLGLGDLGLGDLGLGDLGLDALDHIPKVGDVMEQIPFADQIFKEVCSKASEEKLEQYVKKYNPIINEKEAELVQIKIKFEKERIEVQNQVDNYIQLLKLSLKNA